MAPLVLLDREGPVAILTMNRPEAMNSLSRALQAELAQRLAEVEADASVRVVVLTGSGTRAFTAGLDLKEAGQSGLQTGSKRGWAEDPVFTMLGMRKPIIGAVNGVAITGGFELALACDMLIGSTNARFADTHVRVGVIPGWGLSTLSRRISISRAKEMSLSGNFISAETALAWGLLNRVVQPHELLPAAKQLAADIANCDPDMVSRYKSLIDRGFDLAHGEAMKLELFTSREDNKRVTAESVATKRVGIVERGRLQKL